MKTEAAKSIFFCFSNSNWFGLPNRDQHIAYHIAKHGYYALFIEEIPSLAMKIKSALKSNVGIQPFYSEIPKKLEIVKPHIIPTYFRSSFSQSIDKIITGSWFNKKIKPKLGEYNVAIISTPIWFFLLGAAIDYFDIVIYDIYDDLKVSARNNHALRYLKRSEQMGIKKCDFVICSSPGLQKYIKEEYALDPFLIRNAIDSNFFFEDVPGRESKNIIGIVGLLDIQPDKYNFDLLEIIIKKFLNYEVVVVGRMTINQIKHFSKFPNFKFNGIKKNNDLRKEIAEMTVCLIPFLSNTITESVNPLKLYEYLAFGKPVVATNNFDFGDSKDLIYLAENNQDFIQKIETALKENNVEKKHHRMNWARHNTWDQRIIQILNLLRL